MSESKAWLAWFNLEEPPELPAPQRARYALLQLHLCGVAVNVKVPEPTMGKKQWPSKGDLWHHNLQALCSYFLIGHRELYLLFMSCFILRFHLGGKKVLQELKTSPYETKNTTAETIEGMMQVEMW